MKSWKTPRCFGLLLASWILWAGAAFADPLQMTRGVFTISCDAADAETARAALPLLEEAAEEFSGRLPIGSEPVRVIIAPTPTEFLRQARGLGGMQVSGFARPEKGLIVVKSPRMRRWGDDFGGTLRHELVHVLLERNTDTDRLPRWLNEGIAMSLADEYRWAAPYALSRMYLESRIIPYKDLDFAFLAPGSELQFSDAYAQALSMTRFLRKWVGEDAFWRVVLDTGTDGFGTSLQVHGGITVLEFWHRYAQRLWWVALISFLASGSLFGPMALLVIVVWFRKRGANRRTLARWAMEEEAEEEDDMVLCWDDVAEDPDAWRQGRPEDE